MYNFRCNYYTILKIPTTFLPSFFSNQFLEHTIVQKLPNRSQQKFSCGVSYYPKVHHQSFIKIPTNIYTSFFFASTFRTNDNNSTKTTEPIPTKIFMGSPLLLKSVPPKFRENPNNFFYSIFWDQVL